MKSYYTSWPICPACGEPALSGNGLIELENYYACSCGACFVKTCDLTGSAEFINTVEQIRSFKNLDPKKIPLVSKIKFNHLETQYLNWIHNAPTGMHLITWPWRTVKFIPAVISELIGENKSKIVVIGKLPKESIEGIVQPNFIESFENLAYIPERELESDLKAERKKFSKKNVFEPAIRTKCRIEKIKDDKDRKFEIPFQSRIFEEYCNSEISDCRSRLKTEYDSSRNSGPIRKITALKGKGNGRTTALNDDGILDVELQEEIFTPKLDYFDLMGFWTYITSENITVAKDVLNYQVIEDSFETPDLNSNLYFIDFGALNEKTIEKLEYINPDVVIIPDFDDFVQYISYRYRGFLEYFGSLDNKLCLFFSTRPHLRQAYFSNIDSTMPNTTVHTWDSENIFKKIFQKFRSEEPPRQNPVSTTWAESMHVTSNSKTEFNYENVEYMEDLDDFLSKFDFNNQMKKNLTYFMKSLQRSPLCPKGQFTISETLSRNLKGLNLTYAMISSELSEISREYTKILAQYVNNIFSNEEDYQNPLFNRLCELIEENLPSSNLQVIVNYWDVFGLKSLLKKKGFSEEIKNKKITITDWSKANEFSENNLVISLVQPYGSTPIHDLKIPKVVFLGSISSNDRLKKIITSRISDYKLRPVHVPGESEAVPKLLKDIFEELGIDKDSEKELKEYVGEIAFESSGTADYSNYSNNQETTHKKLETGDKAYLILNELGGLFIPLNSLIFVKSENTFEEINFDPGLSKIKNSLIGREILLDKNELYMSFKTLFMEIMVRNCYNSRFVHGDYEWNGFQTLFNDSIYWIKWLETFYNKSVEDHSNIYFQTKLSEQDLNAQNPEHIYGWWSNFEKINIDGIVYPLYNTEHPRSLKDLKKVHDWISGEFEANVPFEDIEKSYYAAIMLQKIRRSSMKGQIHDIKLKPLYDMIKRELFGILSYSRIFKIGEIKPVEISRETVPFKVIPNYQQFVDKMD